MAKLAIQIKDTVASAANLLTTASASVTITTTDKIRSIDATDTGNQVFTFPPAIDNIGREITIYKSADGGQVSCEPDAGDFIDVYGVTGSGAISVMNQKGNSVVWECVSSASPHWRVKSGGAYIKGFVSSGNVVCTAYFYKVNSLVQVRLEGISLGGSGVQRIGNVLTSFPSALLPGSNTAFITTNISGNELTCVMSTTGALIVYTNGATSVGFSLDIGGSYHIR